MPRIEYARGRNLRDNMPEQRAADDFGQFIAALDRDRAPSKTGAAYICGPMQGKRGMDNAQPRIWLPLDADRIAASEHARWREWCAQHAGVAWPTHNSTENAPRDRVIILLDRPASREECIATGVEIVGKVRAEFGDVVQLDECVFRPEQAVHVPPTRVRLEVLEGRPIQVVASPQAQMQATPRDVVSPPQSSSVQPLYSSVPLLWVSDTFEPDCVPTDIGQRNDCLWNLARRLKARKADAAYPEVRVVATAWHAKFVDVIGTKAVMVTVADLWHAYQLVKFPMGVLMTEALKQVDAVVLPLAIGQLSYGEQECRLLRLCIALAHQQPHGAPFFISVRKVDELIGIDYSDAAKVLKGMVRDGVLELVQKGVGKHASRYRLGPPLAGQ